MEEAVEATALSRPSTLSAARAFPQSVGAYPAWQRLDLKISVDDECPHRTRPSPQLLDDIRPPVARGLNPGRSEMTGWIFVGPMLEEQFQKSSVTGRCRVCEQQATLPLATLSDCNSVFGDDLQVGDFEITFP